MKLLTTRQQKAMLGLKQGRLQAMLQLQPMYRVNSTARERLISAGFQYVGKSLCPYAGVCGSICLKECGHNSQLLNKYALPCRIRRTNYLLTYPAEFLHQLQGELERLTIKALNDNLKPVCRLNCLSDLYWPRSLFDTNPRIQFLDYTKDLTKALNAAANSTWPTNYHMTLSWSEKIANPENVIRTLYKDYRGRVNIAVITNIRKTLPMPKKITLAGIDLPLIDGDTDDLRFLDKSGAVIGLRFKKPKIAGGFIPPRNLSKLVYQFE